MYLEENPNTCVEYKRNEDIPSLASKTSLCIIDSLGFLTIVTMMPVIHMSDIVTLTMALFRPRMIYHETHRQLGYRYFLIV